MSANSPRDKRRINNPLRMSPRDRRPYVRELLSQMTLANEIPEYRPITLHHRKRSRNQKRAQKHFATWPELVSTVEHLSRKVLIYAAKN